MSKAAWTTPKICDHGSNLNEPWYIHFRYTNPDTGIRKQFRYKKGINYYSTLEERRREAKNLSSELKELLKGGWNPWKNEIEKPKTVADLHEEMWGLKQVDLEKDSIRTYIYKYRHWSAWLKATSYGDFGIGQFTTEHAFEYLDHCTRQGHTGAYFNSYRQMAFSLFEMLKDRKKIKENPFSETKNQPKNKPSATIFTPAQIRMVRKYLLRKNPDLGIFCDFIYYTFMRPKELTLVQVKHIDFDQYRIKLPPDIAKNDTQRTVVLPPALRKHINQLRKELQPIYDQYSRQYPDLKIEDYYLFGHGCRPHPKRYAKRDSVTDMFREQVQIPLRLSKGHTPYVFKHTGVDNALAKGVSISGAMRQTGHKSLKNFQIYMRSLNREDNPEFETIDF